MSLTNRTKTRGKKTSCESLAAKGRSSDFSASFPNTSTFHVHRLHLRYGVQVEVLLGGSRDYYHWLVSHFVIVGLKCLPPTSSRHSQHNVFGKSRQRLFASPERIPRSSRLDLDPIYKMASFTGHPTAATGLSLPSQARRSIASCIMFRTRTTR